MSNNVSHLPEHGPIDENGREYHCLDYDKYEEVLVKNSDGVDLRIGCHDIKIENITGFIDWENTEFCDFKPTLYAAERHWDKHGYRGLMVDVMAEYSKLYHNDKRKGI